MAWIRMIHEDEADGELKETYDRFREPWGGVDHILKIHSLDPESLKWHVDMYKHLMYGRGIRLTRAQREMVAVVVSTMNRCVY